MRTDLLGEARFDRASGRPQILPGLVAAALAALFWGLLVRSLWVGAGTLALAAIPGLVLRAARLPVVTRIAIAFLTGGTVSAIALLTQHAALP